MRYQVIGGFKAKTPKGETELRTGQMITVPLEDLAQKLINGGKIIPFDPFENLQDGLWPKLIHCSWGNLTKEEQAEWETAIKIQGEAERSGDIKKWQEMASVLLKIAETVRGRMKPTKEELLSLSLEEFKAAKLAVRIRSKVIGEDIFLASNEAVRDHLKAEGLACYLPEEILHLQGISQAAIKAVHEAKKIFEKSRVIELKESKDKNQIRRMNI